MNSKFLRKVKSQEESREIEELFEYSYKFREMLTNILEEEKEVLEKKALSLSPSLMWKWRYNKLTAEIRARNSLINLLKN